MKAQGKALFPLMFNLRKVHGAEKCSAFKSQQFHLKSRGSDNKNGCFYNNSVAARWSEVSWIKARDVKDMWRAQNGMGEVTDNGLKDEWNRTDCIRWNSPGSIN